MPGYISLHRDIQKHWLYEEERVFSRYEAWLDILMRVNHAEGKVTHNGTLETVLRGSTIWSKGDMEKHWKWSNSKVTAFLKRLENDGMLTVNSTTKKTYLTVVNYEKYQSSDGDKTPPKHHRNTTETYQKHTNNNELIITNNEKEKEVYTPIVEDTEIIFKHWNTKKIIMHRTLTAVMKGKIHARLEDLTVDEMLEAINNYVIIISDNEKYWYSHRFTLLEFVNPKNLDRFLTENNPFEALKKNVISFNKDKPSNVKTGIPDMDETQAHLDEMTRLQEAKRRRIEERVSS